MSNAQVISSNSELRLFVALVGVRGALSTDLIAQLNALCDEIEDAAVSETPAVLLQLSTEAKANAREHPASPGHVKDNDVYLVGKWEKVLRRLETLKAVLICAAEGAIGGLGTALMLVADYRVATGNCLIDLKMQDGEIMPSCSLQRLVQQVGSGPSRKMILLGTAVSTEQALDWGLVDDIVTDAGAAARHFVADLSSEQVCDIAIRRHLMLDAFHQSHEQALGTHLAACDRLLRRQ